MTPPSTSFDRALELLRLISPSAEGFRPGQWEAISALVVDQSKVVLVQRTGWGKSAVYFIATRILRDQGRGPTLIVSPLLALMRNQIEMAERAEIVALTINSINKEDWEEIEQQLARDQVDLLLISPERLNNPAFLRDVLPNLLNRVGLLVVDEVHCISDWGHDFRPDYRRLARIVESLPPTTPVLGTTATANNRVVADIVAHRKFSGRIRSVLLTTETCLFMTDPISVTRSPIEISWPLPRLIVSPAVLAASRIAISPSTVSCTKLKSRVGSSAPSSISVLPAAICGSWSESRRAPTAAGHRC